MNIKEKVDYAIKQVWIKDISIDYQNDFTFKEDTLKNAFYHHLRTRLGDGFLKRNRIRIYTEYLLENGERADIAIVRLDPKKEFINTEYRIQERVYELLAVIELKYKSGECNCNPFYADIDKVRKYIRLKRYNECLFYLGFIHETNYSEEESSWLSVRQQKSWAKGRLVELVAHYQLEGTGDFKCMVISHNELNPELNLSGVNIV